MKMDEIANREWECKWEKKNWSRIQMWKVPRLKGYIGEDDPVENMEDQLPE